MSVPAALRDAATVMLLRDGPGGMEVYLLRRVRSMPFAGGMTAYPGGSVDRRDAEVELAWFGLSPAWWAAAFGTDERLARALVCAAVRETFEEASVLLAGPPGPGPSTVDVAGPDGTGAEWEGVRRALLAGTASLAEVLAGRGLAVRADLLRPWARWVTPAAEPRRYDTRFFVAALPAGQHARDVSGEAEQAGWIRPADALAEFEAGARPMLPPTTCTLRGLLGHPTVDSALAAAPAEPIEPVLPTLAEDADGLWAVMPDGARLRLPAREDRRP